MPAVDLALGFGAAALFQLIYGFGLRGAWPHVFGAEWPSLGADAAGALFRARVVDAVFGVGFGTLLANAAVRGWLRKPKAAPLVLAVGVVLHVVLDAHGSRSVVAAILATPFPWVVVALIAVSAAFGRRKGKGAPDEV